MSGVGLPRFRCIHRKLVIICFDLILSDDLARVALTDMPPRSEEELDPVTLHNNALINMETNPTEGFQKLQYLLQQDSFPPETFANLLLLYIKYEVSNNINICLLIQPPKYAVKLHDIILTDDKGDPGVNKSRI